VTIWSLYRSAVFTSFSLYFCYWLLLFATEICSDGPQPWPQLFESIIQGYEKALQAIGIDSSPLGKWYWDSQARKSSFSRYFCTWLLLFRTEMCSDGPQPWPSPSNRSFKGMRRPSKQSELIAVPLGSVIGTHRPEKARFPYIFVPGCYFLQRKCAQTDQSRGPNSSNRSFKGMRRPSNQSELIAVPLRSAIETHRPEKARFPVFLYLVVLQVLAQKVLRRSTAVAPTLRIDHSEVLEGPPINRNR
jgi:hypothetical protein